MTITSFLDLHILADRVADAPKILADTLADTRAFDGCVGVDVLIDVADPQHFIAVERWESIEHDDAYRAWRATDDGKSELATIVSQAPVLTRLSTAPQS